jgi:hypothetical protein
MAGRRSPIGPALVDLVQRASGMGLVEGAPSQQEGKDAVATPHVPAPLPSATGGERKARTPPPVRSAAAPAERRTAAIPAVVRPSLLQRLRRASFVSKAPLVDILERALEAELARMEQAGEVPAGKDGWREEEVRLRRGRRVRLDEEE